ncbi:MAG: ATP-binding protein [Acidobacteria bacterium]|nr:ATP-binding protein [Acidobacteriota bacterium]
MASGVKSARRQRIGLWKNFASGPPDHPSAWDRVRTLVRLRVSPGNFDTWFRPTHQASHDGTRLLVEVPNDMFGEWMRTTYLDVIHEVLPTAGLGGCQIEFVTRAALTESRSRRPEASGSRPVSPPVPRARLNARYTFDTFVVSSCNNFAHAAAKAVSEQPGATYNPLFLYGGVGLGKTHLMQAIGHQLTRSRPELRIAYLTSEEFVNELISSIRYEQTGLFRDRYRSVDVLLIDDIQFIAGKESTQEEFFHTFNALYDGQKQIVVTCDSPPRSIPTLEDAFEAASSGD